MAGSSRTRVGGGFLSSSAPLWLVAARPARTAAPPVRNARRSTPLLSQSDPRHMVTPPVGAAACCKGFIGPRAIRGRPPPSIRLRGIKRQLLIRDLFVDDRVVGRRRLGQE